MTRDFSSLANQEYIMSSGLKFGDFKLEISRTGDLSYFIGTRQMCFAYSFTLDRYLTFLPFQHDVCDLHILPLPDMAPWTWAAVSSFHHFLHYLYFNQAMYVWYNRGSSSWMATVKHSHDMTPLLLSQQSVGSIHMKESYSVWMASISSS